MHQSLDDDWFEEDEDWYVAEWCYLHPDYEGNVVEDQRCVVCGGCQHQTASTTYDHLCGKCFMWGYRLGVVEYGVRK